MKDCVLYAPMIGSREGELTAAEARGLEAHLSTCDDCRAIARGTAALDGLVAEALLARANARDFAPFVDGVMARVGMGTEASVRPELVEGRTTHPSVRPERRLAAGQPESKGAAGFLSWLRRHRRAAVATLAPALAALAVIVYVRLGSGGGEIAMLEVSSEGEATTILQTNDGPVVLLSEENGS